MMVLLVVYKSRCRYGKSAISDVQLAAAAAAVEEEEQQVSHLCKSDPCFN